MDMNLMTRILLKGTVKKTIHGLKRDPERTLRNIVELAEEYANGSNQKELFMTTRGLLHQEDSAYYSLVKRLAADVASETLETFCFNLGYNSCTEGTRRLRENQERLGVTIPWLVGLSADGIPNFAENAGRVMTQGEDLGVYLYLLWGRGGMTEPCIQLCRSHPECALLLVMRAEEITPAVVQKLRGLPNAMVIVGSQDRRALKMACNLLRQEGLLYAIYALHGTAQRAEALLTEESLTFFATLGPSCLFLCGDGKEPGRNLQERVARLRLEQRYPMLVIDVASDVARIDQVISGRPSSLAFWGLRQVATWQKTLEGELCDLRQRELVDILRFVGQGT